MGSHPCLFVQEENGSDEECVLTIGTKQADYKDNRYLLPRIDNLFDKGIKKYFDLRDLYWVALVLREEHFGDRVLLKVSPWKGVVRFGKKGKLAPRYVGPFEIVECVGPVAYRLKLPQELSYVHDTFHVSNLKKCLAEPDPFKCLWIDRDFEKICRFVEEDIEIVD
ncbi:hypothetical protein Tco_0406936 [Tanacetum coccineum]